jgi:uncharacterized protein
LGIQQESTFMTDEASQPPEDNQQDNADVTPQEEVVVKKISRGAIITLLITTVVASAAIIGIVIAFNATHENPEAITIPSYSEKSLNEKYPMTEMPSLQPKPVEQDNSMDHMEEQEQNETPLELKGQTAPAKDVLEKKSVLEKSELHKREEQLSPQSAIKWAAPKAAPKEEPKAAVVHISGNPQIAIVIDDMGLNMRNSAQMAQLIAPMTLAYMPYAQNLSKQTKTAWDHGHELIVHMPMEPEDIKHNNPGPNALLTTNTADENIARLNKNLHAFTGYIGLNNHMGSKLTADSKAMRPILQSIKDRGLWFLDSRTIGNSVAGKIAAELNIPSVTRDIFLDNVESVTTILAQLRQTEAVAQKRGYAVAIGHPHNATIAALKIWLPEARKKGFKLVPLSEIIAARYPAAKVPKYAQLKKTIVLTQHGTTTNQ